MVNMNEDEVYLTAIELAERVGVSVSLIRKFMRDGELEYVEYSPKNRKIKYSSWLALVSRKTRGGS